MRPLRCNTFAVAARCSASLPRARWRSVKFPLFSSANRDPIFLWRQIAPFSSFHNDHGFEIVEPTIYALSTAPGRAAIAIVRISGTACIDIYHALCPNKRSPIPRYAAVRSIYEPSTSNKSSNQVLIDSEALVLYFPAPKTATGEDVLELHVHGGPAVVKAVLDAIAKCSTTASPVRYAEPGEFTRRAFLNDRLDLTQVEALGETLTAVTEEQRRIAVQGARGGLAARYESWRQLLLYARGELEALIDFSEDQHFDESPASLAASVAVQVRSLARRIDYHSANAMRGELLRNGISMSLIGAPNVGKSSLLNLIVGRNAAIVSKEAGTTRDVVEIGLDLGGFFCRLGDTAGLRKSSAQLGVDAAQLMANIVGDVEREGIRRAKERAQQSDVVILVLSVEPSIQNQGAQLLLDDEVLHTATQLLNDGKTVVVAVNKVDNYNDEISLELLATKVTSAVQTVLPAIPADRIFCLSCWGAENLSTTRDVGSRPQADNSPKPGSSSTASTRGRSSLDSSDPGQLQAFLAGLARTFRILTSPLVPAETEPSAEADAGSDNAAELENGPLDPSTMWHESLGATQRQRALLDECTAHLHAFLEQVDKVADHADDDNDGIDIVVAAESLRAAADCLGKITGRGEAGDVEEVLGVVFEKFCVGK